MGKTTTDKVQADMDVIYVVSNRAPRRYTARELIYLVRHAKTHPSARYQIDYTTTWTAKQVRAWFMTCLHRKINREDSRPWRCLEDEYQQELQRDARVVNDWYGERIRNRGHGLLRTPECKRRYPHIDSPEPD